MRIKVRVVPRAKREKIEEFDEGLKVYVTKPALRGEANRRLLEILAPYFKVKKSCLRIIKGQTSRDKIIELT
jgi:uncharacterized protein (TIGR00251 family)